MKKTGVIRSLLAAAVMAAYGGMAGAQVAEAEPNTPISAAQPLTVDASGSVTVSASFTTGDVDFYTFEGKAGDKVAIDINGGMQNNLDLLVTLLGPNQFGPQQALTGNDDCNYPADIDPCINTYTLLNDGVYYVGVTHAMAQVLDNGALSGYFAGVPVAPGGYTMTVSGVTPKEVAPPQDPPPSQEPPAQDDPSGVQAVRIDIRPGERAETATVHLSRAKIPVAILSSDTFDATQIDTSTLTFGRTGDEPSLMQCSSKSVRVNRRRDMVCLFSIEKAGFEPNDLAGILKGSTRAGTRFEGQGLLKVVEIKKRKRDRDRHDWRRDDDDHDRRHWGGRHDRDDNDRRKHRR